MPEPHPLIFSRRAALAGFAAAPALAAAPAPDTAALCARYRALTDEIERLTARWRVLEVEVMAAPGWRGLSEAQRDALPQALAMARIDARLEVLFARRAAALEAVLASAPVDARGVAGKLAVAARVLVPEDAPQAHALVSGALGDLLGLRCGGCGARVAH